MNDRWKVNRGEICVIGCERLPIFWCADGKNVKNLHLKVTLISNGFIEEFYVVSYVTLTPNKTVAIAALPSWL
jgi:hypothetical protein